MKELPERERPREKMWLLGAAKLSDAELLAVLLNDGAKNVSATELAHKILAADGNGMAFLAGCAPDELARIRGVGMAKSCRIAAAVELGKRLAAMPKNKRFRVGSPQEIADVFMEDMRPLKNESFRILCLNVRNEIMAVEEISKGNANSSVVDPRTVFRPAIRRGAVAVALVHNHPSGNPEPSLTDAEMTARLVLAGEMIGIRVVDHLIIGDGIFVSLKQRGLMD